MEQEKLTSNGAIEPGKEVKLTHEDVMNQNDQTKVDSSAQNDLQTDQVAESNVEKGKSCKENYFSFTDHKKTNTGKKRSVSEMKDSRNHDGGTVVNMTKPPHVEVNDLVYVMDVVSTELKAVEDSIGKEKENEEDEGLRLVEYSSSESGTEDSDSDSDSDSEDEESSDTTSSESDSDSDAVFEIIEQEVKKPEDEMKGKNAPKIPGEMTLEEFPVEPEKSILLDDNTPLEELGFVKSIVESSVVVEARAGKPAIDNDSLLFLSNRKSLGKVFEIFGPVKNPFYLIKFNNKEEIAEREIKEMDIVYYAPQLDCYTSYVFTSQLQKMKGSDASWKNDEEPPVECLQYSDDEEEAKAKAELKRQRQSKRRKNEGESESTTTEGTESKATDSEVPVGRGRGHRGRGRGGDAASNSRPPQRGMRPYAPRNNQIFQQAINQPHPPHPQLNLGNPRPFTTAPEFLQPMFFPGQQVPYPGNDPRMFCPQVPVSLYAPQMHPHMGQFNPPPPPPHPAPDTMGYNQARFGPPPPGHHPPPLLPPQCSMFNPQVSNQQPGLLGPPPAFTAPPPPPPPV